MIRDHDWIELTRQFRKAEPFNHIVIDNFFENEVAHQLELEFPAFNDANLNEYNSPLEVKKTLNHWDRFPPLTYKVFNEFGRQQFLFNMRGLIGDPTNPNLWYDYGLNGGGWHMHGRGGNNNVHLDYNIHPKLDEQRKLNIIVYLTSTWDASWGGGLELWTHNSETNGPGELVKTVDNKFNRAIIFDTTQNSWHGLPKYIDCPPGLVRRSIAAYFVQPAPAESDNRGRALFAPREEQKNDPGIKELIRKRADVQLSTQHYKA